MSIKTRSFKYHLTQQISFSPNYISTNNNQILYCRIDKMLHFYDSTPHKSSNCFTNTDAPGCIHQSDHSVTTVTVTEIPPWYHEGNSLHLELESKICKKSMKEQEVKLRLFKSYAKILTTEPEFLSLQKKDHSMFKWYFSKLHIALTKSFRLLETSVFLTALSQSNSSSPPFSTPKSHCIWKCHRSFGDTSQPCGVAAESSSFCERGVTVTSTLQLHNPFLDTLCWRMLTPFYTKEWVGGTNQGGIGE